MVKKENIPYSKLIINAQNKAKVCQEEHIDIFLDDDINNCLKVSEIGVKAFIMDNLDNILENNNIDRIKDFYEFNKCVKKYIQTEK